MSHWASTASRVIQEVHDSLPEDATLAQRKAAIDAAYPFGERAYSPYKTWLRKRRAYLGRYGYRPKASSPETPLEAAIRRSHELTAGGAA